MKKFLVIRRDNIGDLVCTTPLIHALRLHFPEARIDALVNSYNRPVLECNPDIDHVYAYTKAKHRESHETALGVHWRRLLLMASLRRQNYDYAIMVNSGSLSRSLKFARWVRPKHIIGFVPEGREVPEIDLPVLTDKEPRHEAENVFRLLAPLGIEGPPPALQVVASAEETLAAQASLAGLNQRDGLVVAIHISARKVPQRWPADRFAALMHRLHREFGYRFVLLWSPGNELNPLHPGDDRKAAEIMKACSDLPVLGYPTHRLAQLIGALSVCNAMICSDGGAMHVGAGLGLPVVCFFGNSDVGTWYPWGVPKEILQKPSRDVNDIVVEEAVEAFHRLKGAVGF